MTSQPPTGFGDRLTLIRKSRALTQTELGELVGTSKRMIAYYESEDAQPPGPLLASLARALEVTTDELLGLEPTREVRSPRTAKLMRRLARVEKLPPADQRAVLQHIDALLSARGVEAHGEVAPTKPRAKTTKRSAAKKRATAKRARPQR